MKEYECHVEGLGHYPEVGVELWSSLPLGSDFPFSNITVEAAWKMGWGRMTLEAGNL